MNLDLINKLNNGIFLEKSNQMLKWKTPFKSLKELNIGSYYNSKLQNPSLLYKNEKILNGISIDLIIINLPGFLGRNNKFDYAYGYIPENKFNNIKEQLNEEFGKESKHKIINDLEYKYTWKLKKCKIQLMQQDRFGPNWIISIQHRSNFYGILK